MYCQISGSIRLYILFAGLHCLSTAVNRDRAVDRNLVRGEQGGKSPPPAGQNVSSLLVQLSHDGSAAMRTHGSRTVLHTAQAPEAAEEPAEGATAAEEPAEGAAAAEEAGGEASNTAAKGGSGISGFLSHPMFTKILLKSLIVAIAVLLIVIVVQNRQLRVLEEASHAPLGPDHEGSHAHQHSSGSHDPHHHDPHHDALSHARAHAHAHHDLRKENENAKALLEKPNMKSGDGTVLLS